MDCSPPGSSVHGDSPGKNTGMGCHALLQGIFPTQGSNPGLPHCRWIPYHLSHQGSPRILKWVPYIPSPADLSDPGIKPGSPALQADSLPAEPPGKARGEIIFFAASKDLSLQWSDFHTLESMNFLDRKPPPLLRCTRY